jgi:lysophospholipase L1-like esterase
VACVTPLCGRTQRAAGATYGRAMVRRAAVIAAVVLSVAGLQASAAGAAGPLVALGDSYSSGEGAPPFEPASHRGRNHCHRSTGAWPIRLAHASGMRARSVACSGAKVEDLLESDARRKNPETRLGQVAQLAQLAALRPSTVTLTIGGNDVGFAKVLRDCVDLGDCRAAYRPEGADRLDGRIAALEAQLPQVYSAVRSAAPGARLVVLGYPRIFPREPSSSRCAAMLGLSAGEMRYLNQKADLLNEAIRRAALSVRATFVDVFDVLEGHEARCGDKDWMNRIEAPRVAYSFHPTRAGQGAIARAAIAALGEVRPRDDSARWRDLAQRFRPRLFFDRGERWRPLDVGAFLGERVHRLCRLDVGCPLVEGAATLRRLGVAGGRIPHLQVNGRSALDADLYGRRGERCRPRAGCETAARQRMYYHVTEDADHVYVDYWWFYRYNDAPAGRTYDHQADWEGVVVAVRKDDPTTFEWAGFAEHESVSRFGRHALSCDGARLSGSCGTASARFGRRVDVFVARGTHASYPVPCGRPRALLGAFVGAPCRQSARSLGVHRPEGSFDGAAAWEANEDPRALEPIAAEWGWWPGFWDPGARVSSPSEQPRFTNPAGIQTDRECPAEGCRGPAVVGFERACGGWFGAGTTAAACDMDAMRSGRPTPFRLTIRRGLVDLAAPSALSGAGPVAAGAAQLTGRPLAAGEVLSVEGVAPPDTDLFVRAERGGRVYEARFAALGLQDGGTALVSAEADRGGVALVLVRPDGSRVRRAGSATAVPV